MASLNSDVKYSTKSYGSDPDQIWERYSPALASGKATLLLIHGGYWRPIFDREHFRDLAVSLANTGYEVVLAEYRRISGDPDSTLSDIGSILKSLDGEKLLLIGYSAGGQLALLTAPNYSHVKGIIGLAPVTDLRKTEELGLGENAVRVWLNSSAVKFPHLDPRMVGAANVPIRFIHGTADDRVPIALSETYCVEKRESGADISLIRLEGLGHFELMDPSSVAFPALIQTINSFA